MEIGEVWVYEEMYYYYDLFYLFTVIIDNTLYLEMLWTEQVWRYSYPWYSRTITVSTRKYSSTYSCCCCYSENSKTLVVCSSTTTSTSISSSLIIVCSIITTRFPNTHQTGHWAIVWLSIITTPRYRFLPNSFDFSLLQIVVGLSSIDQVTFASFLNQEVS